jgi:6-pyruvoyltetrahydropterin/6-carboxytetrahydropterin synthase
MNWIVDFGGFKSQPQGNGLSDWLKEMFDHTTLIEKDDPYLEIFQDLQGMGILKLHIMERMGAESMARLIYEKMNYVLSRTDAGRCKVVSVEVFENPNNSAIFGII